MNEFDEEDAESLFINFHLETKITRCHGNTLIPSRLILRADVDPAADVEEEDLSLSLAKVKFWFENIVSKSIAFSTDNEAALEMFVGPDGMNRTGNLLMTTPGEPNDEVLATLFQAKMTALSNGAIFYPFVEVKSDNLIGLTFCFVGDARKVLPTMPEWIGDRTYFDKPWWERNDASTLDIVPPPGADLNVKPAWAYSLDALGGPKQENGIVVRPAFKPTVIPGGKDKD
jgi:hypothetical protein